MSRIFDNSFSKVWNWVRIQRDYKETFDNIRKGLEPDADDITDFLEDKADEGWPEDITSEEFYEIVQLIEYLEDGASHNILFDKKQNDYIPHENSDSLWQCYRKTLKEVQKFDEDTITTIEYSTKTILNYLSMDTYENERENVIKGLVIGNVQSGKTANMEALLSMTADKGWNLYIILSGTIDNLRKQTQSRFSDDFSENEGALKWVSIDRPELGLAPDTQKLDFKNERYFTVCLKNPVRLKRLIKWLHSDPNQVRNMRIIVIDDEADQAGVNTADIDADEKKEIYRLIANLVNQRNDDDTLTKEKFGAMNYIGYTATPYANILNDPRPESLYPKNFISTLPVSKQYFGPQQIFGNAEQKYKGLSIVTIIDKADIEKMKDLHSSGKKEEIPASLIDALLWFICGAAVMRYKNVKKPFSLLIHTSQKTNDHKQLSSAVMSWLKDNSIKEIIEQCEIVWDKYTKEFTFEKLKTQYHDYKAGSNTMKEYPAFSEIKPVIEGILKAEKDKYTFIELGDDKKERKFSKGLHICVDNCKNNPPQKKDGEDDGTFYSLRLSYPKKEDKLDYSTAFIVIGGATLSRGLTIEGLISSYFLRTINASDTLMQMGRWFGYRSGYELLPRLWMSSATREQFDYLSKMDYELRYSIREMGEEKRTPYDYRLKVLLPKNKNLINITSANKMQAVKRNLDFSGSYKQTYRFDSNLKIIDDNIKQLKNLLDILGAPTKVQNEYFSNTSVWKYISVNTILKFLKNYNFSEKQPSITGIAEWLEENDKARDSLASWNVILAGNKKFSEELGIFEYNGIKVNKVNRSKKSSLIQSDSSFIDIGTLTNPSDMLADIDLSDPENIHLQSKIRNPEDGKIKQIRRQSKEKYVPQLVLYVVSKDSVPEEEGSNRESLKLSNDLVGISINIPEQKEKLSNQEFDEYCEIDFERYGISAMIDI